jgi:hypothetical protein
MIGLFCFVLAALASPFKSKLRLEAENAVLRHQLIVLKRRLHGRVRLANHDRWFFIQLYDICFGTSPSQAPKSRPFENTSPVPIAATIALEMIGPMPGTVISRSQA